MSSQSTNFNFSLASAEQASTMIQKCPLLQRVASSWGNRPADWFPEGSANIREISKLSNPTKQLLAQLAEKSGSAGHATALSLMAESFKRGRPRGIQAQRIHPADIKHALTHFTTDGNQPEPAAPFINRGLRRQRSVSTDSSSDSGSDDEPEPQRRRLEQATTKGAAADPSKSAPKQTEMDERSLLALKDLVISGHEDKLKKLQEENDRLAAENARLQTENAQVTKLAGTFCSAWQMATLVNNKQRDEASPPPPLKGEDIDGALAAFESVKDKLAPFLPEGLRTVDAMGAQFDRLVADAMEFEDDEGDCDNMADDVEDEEEEVWGYASDPEDEDMNDDDDDGNGGFPLRLFRDELARAKKGTEKQWVVDEDEDEEAEAMDDE